MITVDINSKEEDIRKYEKEYYYMGIALSLNNTPAMFIFSNNESDMKDCIQIKILEA